MKNTFCTIITASYYPYARALYKSLVQFDSSVELQVLVADGKPVDSSLKDLPGLHLMPVSRLVGYSLVDSLYKKYAHVNMDFFRWSLKPVFINYLLDNGFDKVLFCDCDLFFFDDYHFLFDELNEYRVLLTPQGYTSDPLTDEEGFISLFTKGIFNAGFIGVSKKGIPVMQWWAGACHFRMGVFREYGIHDDQRYLDAVPALFNNIKIIRHKGCNLSAGNLEEAKRIAVGDKIMINGADPVIFIHFAPAMINQIARGHDPLLISFLDAYRKALKEEGTGTGPGIDQPGTAVNENVLVKLKWKLRMRTRIKRFLNRLASKI